MLLAMEEKKTDEETTRKKSVSMTNVKLLSSTVKSLMEIGEAKGQPLWQVVEDLLAAELPAAVKAIQPQLKKVRELKAKTQQIQAEARKANREE